jgi:hypothetical protein
VKRSQVEWLHERNQCRDIGCLTDLYATRIRVLGSAQPFSSQPAKEDLRSGQNSNTIAEIDLSSTTSTPSASERTQVAWRASAILGALAIILVGFSIVLTVRRKHRNPSSTRTGDTESTSSANDAPDSGDVQPMIYFGTSAQRPVANSHKRSQRERQIEDQLRVIGRHTQDMLQTKHRESTNSLWTGLKGLWITVAGILALSVAFIFALVLITNAIPPGFFLAGIALVVLLPVYLLGAIARAGGVLFGRALGNTGSYHCVINGDDVAIFRNGEHWRTCLGSGKKALSAQVVGRKLHIYKSDGSQVQQGL